MVPETGQEVAGLIQMTLVPVIMINAIKLISLFIQSRHSLAVERVYKINRERTRLHGILLERGADDPRRRLVSRQLAEAGRLAHLWMRRGYLTRNALAAAFLGISLFALTSLWLVSMALLSVRGLPNLFGVATFVAGMLSFLASFWFILKDLHQSLSLTSLDTELTDRLLGRGPGE